MTKTELIERIETEFIKIPSLTHAGLVELFNRVSAVIQKSDITVTICSGCGDDIYIKDDTINHAWCSD